MDKERTRGHVIKVKDSSEFRSAKILEYFKDKKRIDITDKNYESAVKLDKMVEIYFNKKYDRLKKYYDMTLLFKTADAFEREFNCLKKEYEKESSKNAAIAYLCSYVADIAEFLRSMESKLSKEEAKSLLELEKNSYFDDYKYAAYFINRYIEYNESPFFRDFIAKEGISEDTFNRFVTIVIDLDGPLYDKFLEKCEENKMIRMSETARKVDNIKAGVTTGYTNDGYEFDEVEFYANLPFDDNFTYKEVFEDFGLRKMPSFDKRFRVVLEELCPENSRDIMGYVYEKSVLYNNPSKITENSIMNTTFILEDQSLSDEAKQEIIAYMKRRNIPFLSCAFNAVKNKYVTKGLEKEDQKVLKK